MITDEQYLLMHYSREHLNELEPFQLLYLFKEVSMGIERRLLLAGLVCCKLSGWCEHIHVIASQFWLLQQIITFNNGVGAIGVGWFECRSIASVELLLLVCSEIECGNESFEGSSTKFYGTISLEGA